MRIKCDLEEVSEAAPSASRFAVHQERVNLSRQARHFAIARPGEIRFTDALPKTLSGKIIRRFLRNLAAGEELVGDISTMEDLSVLDKLREG